VAQICSAPKRIPQFENLDKNKTIIIGSSWQKDEEVFAKLLDEYSNLKLIVVPHEIDHERIASVESIFEKQKSIKLSKTDESSNLSEFNVIIVDSIGLLSSIYQYGFFAHIGGGFGKGIHNVLEAACYGMPIIFGPNYEKFEEAKSLIKLGGAFCVKNHVDLKNIFEKKLNNEIEIRQASEISKKFVENNIGASDKIFDSIF
jgi:3-deoxy-D-manno-octulosonic-acid transferase